MVIVYIMFLRFFNCRAYIKRPKANVLYSDSVSKLSPRPRSRSRHTRRRAQPAASSQQVMDENC